MIKNWIDLMRNKIIVLIEIKRIYTRTIKFFNFLSWYYSPATRVQMWPGGACLGSNPRPSDSQSDAMTTQHFDELFAIRNLDLSFSSSCHDSKSWCCMMCQQVFIKNITFHSVERKILLEWCVRNASDFNKSMQGSRKK